MTTYKLNEDQMFADINDGVAIVINSETGIYYGMNGFATAVFENLIRGVDSQKIIAELQKLPNVSGDIEVRFNAFLNAVIEKNLILPLEQSTAAEVVIDANIALSDQFDLNVTEYNDAQELLLADPIHEVKEETGWSPEKAALNTDAEDVARREAKMDE